MKIKNSVCIMFSIIILTFFTSSIFADVTVRQKTKIKFHGTMGSLINAFSSAGNDQKTKTFVKGNFSRTEEKDEITIVDLQNGQIITINKKKKEYSILTFAEMKKKMQESAEMFKSQRMQDEEYKEPDEEPRDYEVLFDINRTGESKKINGMKTDQLIMIITLKQKGVALEDSGGMVITADQWLASDIAGYDEMQAFQKKMVEKMEFPYSRKGIASGINNLLFQYPQLKEGMEKLNKEMEKTGKIPVKSTTTIEVIKSKRQMAEAGEDETEITELPSAKKIFGGLAKKLAKKKLESGNRSTLMDIYSEIEKVDTKPIASSLFEISTKYKKVEAFQF